jgi:hypothetical protein
MIAVRDDILRVEDERTCFEPDFPSTEHVVHYMCAQVEVHVVGAKSICLRINPSNFIRVTYIAKNNSFATIFHGSIVRTSPGGPRFA